MKLSTLVAKARKEKVTLLGVGPVSENAVVCALAVAREMNAPVIFVASRNQVETPEIGKGYVRGWSPGEMAGFIRENAASATYFLERDHGGPWQRDEERNPYLPEEVAFRQALISYQADLKAGFHLLHIDPTRRKNTCPDQVVKDAVYLMAEIEKYRKKMALPPVDYEIGTEENYAGVMEEEKFCWLLQNLLGKLQEKKLPRPVLVVGQTGSLVKMDYNAGCFNPRAATRMAALAGSFGVGLKEHNTDYLEEHFLLQHRLSGITSANVAPEFGVLESKMLLKLALEEELLKEKGKISHISGFKEVFISRSLATGKWQKWLDRERGNVNLENDYWRLKLTGICGHYVFADPEVRQKRRMMMENLKVLYPDPEGLIREEIKNALRKYFRCFGLENFLKGEK